MHGRGRYCAGATAAALLVAGATTFPPADRPDDRAASVGRWRVVAVTMNGRELDPDLTAMLSSAYAADGTWRLFFRSLVVAEGVSSNHPDTVPASFEMRTLGHPPDDGRAYWGIYEMTADRRRLCFAAADQPRPTEFSAPRASGRTLVEFERIHAR